MRTPRKTKKIRYTGIALDINAFPEDLAPIQVLDIFDQTGKLLYDSQKGEKPFVLGRRLKRVRIIDVRKNFHDHYKKIDNGRKQ